MAVPAVQMLRPINRLYHTIKILREIGVCNAPLPEAETVEREA
jgi:hypothetical protein